MKRSRALLSSLYDGLLVVLNYVSVVLIFLTAIWIFGDVVGRFIFNQPIVPACPGSFSFGEHRFVNMKDSFIATVRECSQ